MNIGKKEIVLYVVGILLLLPLLGLSQPGGPGGDPDIPIDAGIGFLIAAGAAFGIKKVYDFNKKK